MKRWFLLLSCSLALSACSPFKTKMTVELPAAVAPLQDYRAVPIERVAFRPGVSSVTVERLGKQAGCDSDEGAGLLTERGPVEVYRMVCNSGQRFMARCELRQCKAM